MSPTNEPIEKKWSSISSIKTDLIKQWNRGKYFKNNNGNESLFPLRITVRGPKGNDINEHFEKTARTPNDSISLLDPTPDFHFPLNESNPTDSIISSGVTWPTGLLGKTLHFEGRESSFPGCRSTPTITRELVHSRSPRRKNPQHPDGTPGEEPHGRVSELPVVGRIAA